MKARFAAIAALSATLGALGVAFWANARQDHDASRQRTWSGLRTLESIDPGTPVGPGFGVDGGVGGGDGQPRALIVITEPGSYFLTANLQVPAGSDGVEIRAGGVTFDLRGFAIRGAGPSSGPGDGIRVIGPDRANITIRNGSITRMGGDGIDGTFARNSTFAGINVSACGGTGIVINEGIVRACNARGNGFGGFQNRGTVVFTECTAIANFGAGFSIVALADDEGRERVIPERERGDGVVVRAGGIYERCSAVSNTDRGFFPWSGAIVTNCQALSNGGAGFFMNGHSSVDRVVASQNQGWNIDAEASRITIRDSSVSDSSVGGVILAEEGLLEGSYITHGTGRGVEVNSSATIIRNNTFNSASTFPTIRLTLSSSDALVISNQGLRVTSVFVEDSGTGNVIGPIISTQSLANSLTNPIANVIIAR